MFSQKVVHWWQCTYNKRPWCFKKFVFSSVGKKHHSAPTWHNITWNPMKKEKNVRCSQRVCVLYWWNSNCTLMIMLWSSKSCLYYVDWKIQDCHYHWPYRLNRTVLEKCFKDFSEKTKWQLYMGDFSKLGWKF